MTIQLNFNLPFDEAIAQMANRGVVLPEIYYGSLQGLHRQLAFSIANIAKVDQLQSVLDSLTDTLKNGGTFAQWQKNLDIQALGLPKHRLDNIFRTNIQQSYNHGQWQKQLANRETKPYLMYDAINDSRTRPTHSANDGVIRELHDPVWKIIWFSRNVYRCRCRLISLTKEQAVKRSGSDNGLYKPITEDPLRDKAWDSVDVLNQDVLSVGIEQAIIKRLADSKNPVLKQAFVKATDVVNAQQLALNYGVKAVSYGGRLDIANEVNIVLSEFKQRGLTIPDHVIVNKDYFEQYAIKNGTAIENDAAVFLPALKDSNDSGYIFLNPAYGHWHDLSKDTQLQFKKGYWSTNDNHHVINHELGHLAHYKNAPLVYLQLVGKTFNKTDMLIAEQVSLYAASAKLEFVAEVFAGLSTGKAFNDDVMALYQSLGGGIL
jgi:SPP1 gp7 family putative phage head morphogenesis protein